MKEDSQVVKLFMIVKQFPNNILAFISFSGSSKGLITWARLVQLAGLPRCAKNQADDDDDDDDKLYFSVKAF